MTTPVSSTDSIGVVSDIAALESGALTDAGTLLGTDALMLSRSSLFQTTLTKIAAFITSAITPTSLGLGNVNNTADSNKPVSTAQANAISTAVSGLTTKTYVDNSVTTMQSTLEAYVAAAIAASGGTGGSTLSVSADGTAISSAGTIVDSALNQWTIVNGVVQQNGAPAGVSSSVSLLLWFGGAIYQYNGINYYKWLTTVWGGAQSDPRIGGTTGASSVYRGMNYHIGLGETIAAPNVAILTDLGINSVRTYCSDTTGAAQIVTAYPLLSAANMRIVVSFFSDPTGTTEATAYTAGKTYGASMAAVLVGKVYAYELCEQKDPVASGDGSVPANYTLADYLVLRGWLAGVAAGIKTIDTTALIAIPSGVWKHVSLIEMLLNGTAPDGSAGGQIIPCDVITWIWYAEMGDITDQSNTALTGGGTVLTRLKALGKPIWISTFGGGTSVHPVPNAANQSTGGTEAETTAWLLDTAVGFKGGFPTVDTAAATWNIQAVFYFDYETDGGEGDMGIVQADGVTKKGRYAPLKAYWASTIMPARNPDGSLVGTVSTSYNVANWPFFGINGHYLQNGLYTSVSLTTQAATLADLGMKTYRQDCYTKADIDTLANTVIPGLGANIQVLPMLQCHPFYDPTLNGATPTETTAYNYAFGLAAYAAQKFAGIPMMEFGNEWNLDPNNGPMKAGRDGLLVTDFPNNCWAIWRGGLRGALAGWRSVDTARYTKLIATATSGYIYFGWLDGMLKGWAPDGTTGHPIVDTDVIQWHFYGGDGGDFDNVSGLQGKADVLQYLKTNYPNIPVIFTELGSSDDESEATIQAYITFTINEMVAAKHAGMTIIGFNWYELYDDAAFGGDGNFGLMTSGTAQKARYATMKAAIAANPV